MTAVTLLHQLGRAAPLFRPWRNPLDGMKKAAPCGDGVSRCGPLHGSLCGETTKRSIGENQQPVMVRTNYAKKRPRWGFCQQGQVEHVYYGNSAFVGARSL